MYWTVPAVIHYNSSVAEHWTIFSYDLYVVCMYFVPLIHLLLPNQINHYYYYIIYSTTPKVPHYMSKIKVRICDKFVVKCQ